MTTFSSAQMLTATNQANLEALQAITQSMLNATERVLALNIGTSRNAIEYVASGANLLQEGGLEGMMARQGAGMRPAAEVTVSYVRSVQDISATAQSEITQALSARVNATTDALIAVLDNIERAGPASASPAVATVKSVISSVRSTYDNILRSGQQVAEANAASVVNAAAAIGVVMPAAKAKKAA